MIIYLYRWRVKTGKEKQFEDNWSLLTKAIRDQCGSYGSRLHLNGSGEYLGYAQWPNVATRESCQVDLHSQKIRSQVREAIEISYPEELLSVRSDFLEITPHKNHLNPTYE